jgi:hypothetical protein
MGRVADWIMDALESEIKSRAECDEPPALYLLYLEGGRCRASQVDVPASYWSAAPPARVLEALAGGLGDFSGLLQPAAPEGLHGAAFRCEMWEVRADPGTEEETRAAAVERRLSAHPDRVEVRSMWAADRGGASYGVTLERESGSVRRLVTYPKPGVPGFTGIIPAALDRLVTAMLGVELPSRAARVTEGEPAALAPARATAEALAALRAAGPGKEHGKPFRVRSWHYGRCPAHTGPECVVTEVTAAKAAYLDDAAMRALLCLPGGVMYSERGRLVHIYREARTPEIETAANQ